MRPRRLRTRVAIAFGALSLTVAVAVGLVTYELVRSYLSDQREQAAVARTLLDAEVVEAQSDVTGLEVSELLGRLPSISSTQRLLRIDDEWFSSGVSVSPDDLPRSLLTTSLEQGGAQQRFTIGDTLYQGVSVPVAQGLYVEVFPLDELTRTLDRLRSSLIAAAALASLIGASVGWYAAGRLLRPLRRLARTADSLAAGSLTERMGSTGDLDLEPISTAFDGMADSMQERIARERRFVANVGHELRTPVTVTLGTVELLETRSAHLRPEDASLLALLSQQVARLAQTVLDLLELGTITPETVPDHEPVDVAEVARGVLDQRGLPTGLVTATGSTMAVTDPRRLERMIANLVDNAQSHAGGVTAVSVLREADGLAVIVDDEGPGVPAEERANIFELFARGSASEPGTGSGLGLTIVAEQAELIGASVDVGASPKGGARFSIHLPSSTVTDPAGALDEDHARVAGGPS